MYKKGQKVAFYIKRYRCWMFGTINSDCEFDKELNCNIYHIKDLTGSNWAVQAELVTDKVKRGIRFFNPYTFKIETY